MQQKCVKFGSYSSIFYVSHFLKYIFSLKTIAAGEFQNFISSCSAVLIYHLNLSYEGRSCFWRHFVFLISDLVPNLKGINSIDFEEVEVEEVGWLRVFGFWEEYSE